MTGTFINFEEAPNLQSDANGSLSRIDRISMFISLRTYLTLSISDFHSFSLNMMRNFTVQDVEHFPPLRRWKSNKNILNIMIRNTPL